MGSEVTSDRHSATVCRGEFFFCLLLHGWIAEEEAGGEDRGTFSGEVKRTDAELCLLSSWQLDTLERACMCAKVCKGRQGDTFPLLHITDAVGGLCPSRHL